MLSKMISCDSLPFPKAAVTLLTAAINLDFPCLNRNDHSYFMQAKESFKDDVLGCHGGL